MSQSLSNMKIRLHFLYLLPLLAIISTLDSFAEFVFPSLIKMPNESPPALGQYKVVLLLCSCGIIALCYGYMALLMKRWLFVVLAALGALALESYAGWNVWMVYPHVFAKLLVLLHVFAIYGFYRRYGLPQFGLLMGLLLLALISNLVFCHPEALNISAFLHNERGVDVTAPMLLLLVTLYYFNEYLTKGRLTQLLAFLLGVGLIIFLQHRSVWISMGVALAMNAVLLALGQVQGARMSSARLLPMALIPFLLIISGGLAAISNPQVVKKLEASIDDIQHADKQGTGSWRLDQFKAYQPFMEEYPSAGMRLKGFELPVQFYHLANDGGSEVPVWHTMTGHHFHSFYIDRLFYFGIAGLLLTLLVPLLLLLRRVLSPVPMPPATASCIIFSLSTLIFSFSYDWPLYFFGVMGLSLAAAAEPSRVLAALAPVPAPASHPHQPALPFSPPYFFPRHASSRPAVRR